jgi:hypothetical protein
MSHRTKSGQKRHQHEHKQRWKRKVKRKKAVLLAEGKIKKGVAPSPRSTAE